MGHQLHGMRRVCGNVSPALRADLKAMVHERWETSPVSERGYWFARSSRPAALRPSGARDQDRLPKSDTGAPGIGTNGPGQLGMARVRVLTCGLEWAVLGLNQ